MNAIAAHRYELERLLKDLSGDIAFSEINFVTLVDAYITRLDANCRDTSAGLNLVPAHINRRIKMEPTLTWNCALYHAQHKVQNRVPPFSKDFALRPASKRRKLISN
jgi:hypothetical protein